MRATSVAIESLSGSWNTTCFAEMLVPLRRSKNATGIGVPFEAVGTAMKSLALGTGILSALGAIGSALTLGLRRGSLLLGLLVLPLAMPALIFGARAIDLSIHGDSARGPLMLLAAMLVLALTLAPPAVAAALRISAE